jgi:hypothetical protein
MGYSPQEDICSTSKRMEARSIAVSCEATQITRTQDPAEKGMTAYEYYLCVVVPILFKLRDICHE